MVPKARLLEICGKTIFENIPHEKIEMFDISYNRYMNKDTKEVNPKGGQTVCSMKIDGQEYIGLAFCSRQDIFSKKAETKIALLRAFEHYWTYVKSIKEKL